LFTPSHDGVIARDAGFESRSPLGLDPAEGSEILKVHESTEKVEGELKTLKGTKY
jgi:hypothetical protein